jgi:TolA-binding protein
VHYFRNRWYPGTITRLENLLAADPAYIRRDSAYYHLAESYYRMGRRKDALTYFGKLVEEFKVSEYLERTQLRLAELSKTAPADGVAEKTASPAAAGEATR